MKKFPQLILDDGKQIFFGQNIQEVERLFGKASVDNPLPIARKGIDRKIAASEVSLEFDAERLRSIEFNKDYQFTYPLKPYAESWKNFEIIEGMSIKGKMPRDEFVAYIVEWES